jgi:hypothetical protein
VLVTLALVLKNKQVLSKYPSYLTLFLVRVLTAALISIAKRLKPLNICTIKVIHSSPHTLLHTCYLSVLVFLAPPLPIAIHVIYVLYYLLLRNPWPRKIFLLKLRNTLLTDYIMILMGLTHNIWNIHVSVFTDYARIRFSAPIMNCIP